MKTHYFECICYSDEHILKFQIDEEEKEIYTTIFLNQYRNVLKRVWIAIKYIFGYKCKYGHWDCWTLRNEDIQKLKELLNQLVRISIK